MIRFDDSYPPGGAMLHGLPANSGQAMAPPPGNVLSQVIASREERIRFLLEHGEMFWLPVALGLGSAPAAGTQFQSVTTSVDFDLLVVGADCTIFKSTIEIRDSARQRLLTNSTTPIGAIADFQVSGTLSMFRNNWYRPYMLPCKSQFALTVTADGTESNGVLTFYCLQPPIYNA
jgi:hypothetical protein